MSVVMVVQHHSTVQSRMLRGSHAVVTSPWLQVPVKWQIQKTRRGNMCRWTLMKSGADYKLENTPPLYVLCFSCFYYLYCYYYHHIMAIIQDNQQ